MTLAILLSPLAVLSLAEAQPEGVPKARCGTLSNPTPGTLCYSVSPGGGKTNAGGSPKKYSTTIQATGGPEYVVADVVIEVTSIAGDVSGPTVDRISRQGEVSVVSQTQEKLRELKRLRADLETKASVLYGPALIEAQTKLSALQEQERNYEQIEKTTVAAGKDVGKFVVRAESRSRSCGIGNFDTCGSWVLYNIYVVERYVGDPIAAYNKQLEVARDAQKTILNLVEQSQQTGITRDDNKPIIGGGKTVATQSNRFSVIDLNGKVYLQNVGDVSFRGGEFAGTRGKSLRLEGFSLAITNAIPNLGIRYMAHLQNIGDTPWVDGGQFIGTRGKSLRLEGFAIELTGSAAANYSVYYTCHLENIGDTTALSDGQFCGTRGESRRLEGMQVWIAKIK